MAIKHATIKAPEDKIFAIADWNANHTGTATPDSHGNEAHSSTFITCGDVPGCETDPVFGAWDKDHDDLSNVTADQHHAQLHGLNSADHTNPPLSIANGGTNSTAFTENQVCYFDGASVVGDANFYYDRSLSRLLIGKSGLAGTPEGKFEIVDSLPFIMSSSYSTSLSCYGWYMRRSHSDTIRTMAETQNGECIGIINFQGCNTDPAYRWGAYIEVDQAAAAGNYVPANMNFVTYNNAGRNLGQFTLYKDGSAVFNEQGSDFDHRIEGDTASSLFVCDAGLDAVQIGTTTAGAIADFRNSGVVFNEDSQDRDFRVESNGNANMIFVDGGNNRVGVGTSSPAKNFHVYGTGACSEVIEGTTESILWLKDAGAGSNQKLFYLTSNDGYFKIGRATDAYSGYYASFYIDPSGNTVINENSQDYDFRVESDTNANMFKLDAGLNIIGIGGAPADNDGDLYLMKDGVLGMKETATPTATADYGKIYTKNDNKLYFQDGAGTEHEVAFV